MNSVLYVKSIAQYLKGIVHIVVCNVQSTVGSVALCSGLRQCLVFGLMFSL